MNCFVLVWAFSLYEAWEDLLMVIFQSMEGGHPIILGEQRIFELAKKT
jgi:hypothetical protein